MNLEFHVKFLVCFVSLERFPFIFLYFFVMGLECFCERAFVLCV